MENQFNKQPEIKKEIISQISLNNFINDIQEYDKQHSSGSWLGKGLIGMIMKKMDGENEEGSGLQKLQEDIQKNLTPNDIYDRHAKVLNKLGIDIESPNKNIDIDENETYAIGELSINITDKDLYLNFLKTLDGQNLPKETEELLSMMSKKFVRQVQEEYLLDSADDRLLELLSGLRNIIAEYDRIGLAENTSNLKDYLEYLNTGYLKEYISAKNHKLFEPIGEGFNLSTYQIDASYDYYINAWKGNFFDELEKIKKNPEATDFYNKVLEYGKACISFAKEDIKRIKEKYKDVNPTYVENIERAVNETQAKIETIK